MYSKDARPMKDLIATLINQLGLSEQVCEQRIKSEWAEIVGDIAVHKITVNYLKSKILHLESSTSVWSNELILRKAEIIEKINAKFNQEIVKDISFH